MRVALNRKGCCNVPFLLRAGGGDLKQRSKWIGLCTGVLGIMLALAPVTAASAATDNSKHHSTKTKGSNPNSAICKDVKAEVVSLSTVGTSIEKAMTSGNFAQVKHGTFNTYNVDAATYRR